MKVTFMGTGTSVGVPSIGCQCPVCRSHDPLNRRTRTSALLAVEEHRVLIDASIDLRQQALREEMDVLHAVLVTHAHADHVFGLDDVRMFNFRQQAPMPIYASAATLADIRRTFWYVFEATLAASSRPQLALKEVNGPFEVAGLRVLPFEVIHGAMPILGYRIGRFAYITDASALPEATFPLLARLDVLVINALRHKPHPTHFTLTGALDTIARIAPRRAYLTHISHDFDHAALSRELPEGVQPAHDGLTIEVDHET
ncbi:MAG TPA: MBL fold metallo-hydrolase [Candidatus Polarisedimenticolia bacterium]|jgi:phosphoribosyl 1,2-cyclic phosphate phosphodiesterase